MKQWRRKRIAPRAASQVSKLTTMSRSDKLKPLALPLRVASQLPETAGRFRMGLMILFICAAAGCDPIGSSRREQFMQEAEGKAAQGDFTRAINLYEAALDDSQNARNAEVHYKLALVYDDKLNDPVSALDRKSTRLN